MQYGIMVKLSINMETTHVVGGIAKFVDVDPNTKGEVFLCSVRDICFLNITPYESLKFMIQPGLMLHPSYVEDNVAEDGTDTYSNMLRKSNVIQPPPTEVKMNSNEGSTRGREDAVNAVIVGDRVGKTCSTNNSWSLCGMEKYLDVERTDTIGIIMEMNLKIKGTTVKDQRLIYAGKHLMEDDRILAHLDTANRSIVHVVQCLRGC
ncbi:hypothetical protein MKW92_026144 [Papaver armeniacum]|nr:hypothetical protein MKW92_026144 [Papaver armeniacum]